MLKKISSHRFFVFLYRAEASSSSFLKLCEFCKYCGKIIFLPTSCVEKEYFCSQKPVTSTFPLSWNSETLFFFLIRTFLLCKVHVFIIISFFHRNLFLITILKGLKPFFSPGDSHTKGMLFVLHLCLEGITEVDTDRERRFVSFKATTSNESSLFVSLQGIAPEKGWLGGAFLKDYKIICKIKMREMKTK